MAFISASSSKGLYRVATGWAPAARARVFGSRCALIRMVGPAARLGKMATELHAAHPGHVDVHQKTGFFFLMLRAEKRFGALERIDFETQCMNEADQRTSR